jgi:hydroxypyruvate isomerase
MRVANDGECGYMLPISANLGFLWTDRPLADRIRAAKAAGFDAVECHWPYDEPAEGVRAALTETGLPMLGLNTRPGDLAGGEFGLSALPGREAEARAAIDDAVNYARAIGARMVHVMAGKPAEGEEKAAHETYLGNLAYACDKAAEKSVGKAAKKAGVKTGGKDGGKAKKSDADADLTILIEPINAYDASGYFLQYAGFAKEIVAALGEPNLKIMFDCYHIQLMQGSLYRWIEHLLPLIGHIQIAAAPTRAEPDEGEIAYDRLIPMIESLGYDGHIGAEYKPRGNVEDGLGWLAAFRAAWQ